MKGTPEEAPLEEQRALEGGKPPEVDVRETKATRSASPEPRWTDTMDKYWVMLVGEICKVFTAVAAQQSIKVCEKQKHART